MNRYHITADLETGNPRGLTRPHQQAIATRLRERWPRTTVLASDGNPQTHTKVAGEFHDPTHATTVLSTVPATFSDAGAPATFHRITITAA